MARNKKSRGRGWHNDRYEHGLAGMGYSPRAKGRSTKPLKKFNFSDKFIKKVEEIEIPIEDIWKAWYNNYTKGSRRRGDYIIKVTPSHGEWEEEEEGKLSFSEEGSRYPDMEEYPVHINPETLIERGLRAHPDEILDRKKDFEKEMEYQDVKEGSEKWKEARQEWIYQTKASIFGRFKSKLLDELKIGDKEIDVNYVGDVEFDKTDPLKP